MSEPLQSKPLTDVVMAKTGPYAGGVRGGSDEPHFRLGSYVIDSNLALLDLNARGKIAC